MTPTPNATTAIVLGTSLASAAPGADRDPALVTAVEAGTRALAPTRHVTVDGTTDTTADDLRTEGDLRAATATTDVTTVTTMTDAIDAAMIATTVVAMTTGATIDVTADEASAGRARPRTVVEAPSTTRTDAGQEAETLVSKPLIVAYMPHPSANLLLSLLEQV